MEGKKTILNHRWFLYLTEFFAGMGVMAVELGASRLLAPYFSSSQIVWTIIIGTIMIAMALGNLYGGRTADKNADPARLYRRILIASVWIAAIPLAGKYIILAITGLLIVSVNTNLLIWAAFLACMVIFVFPLFLLGTVTPSLTKYATTSLDSNASVVGTLGAANTIGSILGTFLPTFVTIPAAGTAVTFLIFSGILLIIALAYFISTKSGKRLAAVAAVLFILCSVFGNKDDFAFWEKDLVYEGESVYNYLQVHDTPDMTYLCNNVLFGVQSVKLKHADLTGLYYDYALAAPAIAGISEKEDPRILILGMGTGTYAGLLEQYFPEASVTGVEIDEKITRLARDFFDMPEDIPVITYDGRAYLNCVDDKYDVIFVDAYQDITIPFQMSSKEFFTLVHDHLKDDGVMAVNICMRSDEEGNINEYLADTISSVFSEVAMVDVKGTTNRELFATDDTGLNARLLKGIEGIDHERLCALMTDVEANLKPYEAGNRVFTDDKAPVELLGMQVIDSLIQGELGHYKELYKEGGFKAILGEV
ncbi:MAG: fused MFS/spermidine synthase [Lachnospiraceae bacterium]|nr:fused MFS/spermidine synthase [Lachnospiraceae bacterium]